jgi:uncharacterized membrane protein
MKNKTTIRNIALAGVVAALSCVLFVFVRIPLPGNMAIHLGNAVVVLGALLLGGVWGGLGGAVGLTIADLITGYAVSAPTTFVLKFCLGFVTGLVAHRFGKINEQADLNKIWNWAMLATTSGLVFNLIFSPLVNYGYHILILGKPAADVALSWNITASAVNAIASLAVSVPVYLFLRPVMKKTGMLA